MKIHSYESFVSSLWQSGMSLGGENGEGIFTLSDYFEENIRWHTQELETDPWEWRMRVLAERDDIAYGKFFFKKSGFITREWYPYFYAVRRDGQNLLEEYEDGNISQYAMRIYRLLEDNREMPLHVIKLEGGFTGEDKPKFDRAITELQMKFYITMCGRMNKVSKNGEAYGWSSTVFCLTEDFFGERVVEEARALDRDQAYEALEKQIYRLNPSAVPSRVKKFILGK